MCGNPDYPDKMNEYVELTFIHNSPTLKLLFGTTMAPKKDGFWGISDF